MKNNGTNREQEIILQGATPVMVGIVTKVRREEVLLKAGALQDAIFNSAKFSSIATDTGYVLFAGHAPDSRRKIDTSLWRRRKPT